MSTTVITPNNPQYSTTGPWSAWAGAWGASSLTYGVNYTQSISLNNTTFPNGTLFSWSFPLYGGPFGVWSYPCIVYGSTPELINSTVPSTQVANFVNLSTSYSAALTVNSGQLDTIFDIWLTSKPYGDTTTVQDELEIVPQTDWQYSPLTYTLTDSTLDNAAVYVSPGKIIVVPSSEMLTGTISISDILKSLIWHGVITGQEYISGIEFGPEPGSGSGSLLINNLSYQWNGTPTIVGTAGNDTFTIAAPGGNDIVGNGGLDTVVYSGLYSQFQIKSSGSETLVTENNNIFDLGLSTRYNLHQILRRNIRHRNIELFAHDRGPDRRIGDLVGLGHHQRQRRSQRRARGHIDADHERSNHCCGRHPHAHAQR